MSEANCAKCGNAEILEGVRLRPESAGSVEDLAAVVSPTSGMIRKQTASEVRGRVCPACGFTELYVTEPQVLAERWRAGER